MKNKVYEFLNSQNIKYEVTDHAPVYTMEEMQAEGLDKLGTICKNLFIRDQKGKKHFLITADNDTRVNLKEIGTKLEAGKVSFASAERLEKYLGLKQGSVTPFGLMNDPEHKVEFFIDKSLSNCKSMGLHPLDNTATLFLSFKDLDKFLWDLDVDAIKIKL